MCFAFQKSYLELIWVSDTADVQTELVRPLALWERSRWRETKASPFGIGLRLSAANNGSLPFKTVPYSPPYLPQGMSIQIAESNLQPSAPLVFIVPASKRPTPPAQTPKLAPQHPLGCREITAVRIRMPGQIPSASEAEALNHLGVVLETGAESHHMELEFNRGARGAARNFSPSIPLSLSW